MSTNQKGFTLIELVVVIAILAILAAVALPRFAELSDEAHRAKVENIGGALMSAVNLARAQWLANGNQVAVTDLPGFGEPNAVVDVSLDGWPTGVSGNTSPSAMTEAECNDLFGALLTQNSAGTSLGVGEDFQTSLSSGDCRYTYLVTADGYYIDYDPETGSVYTELTP
jgi:prepilin-type N-terminal cleavage/methylation domain-containing protein